MQTDPYKKSKAHRSQQIVHEKRGLWVSQSVRAINLLLLREVEKCAVHCCSFTAHALCSDIAHWVHFHRKRIWKYGWEFWGSSVLSTFARAWGMGAGVPLVESHWVVLIKSLESCTCGSIAIDFNLNLPLYHFLLVVQHNSSGVDCRQSMSLTGDLLPAGRTHFACLMFKEKKNHGALQEPVFSSFLSILILSKCIEEVRGGLQQVKYFSDRSP